MTDNERVEGIMAHKNYRHYVTQSNHTRLYFFLLMVVVYFGFILLLASESSFLSSPIHEGATLTVGIIAAFVVEASAILMVFAYVHICNRKVDPLLAKIMEETK